ncbi:WG repeat-containing protein [Sediminicola sp. 1XM1-17]|uniref:WG repeat-containing protein n=1 Tax=Sediminicola sp. 1XM1-17 TaxID=3127702 RepID=UPI003076B7B0
MKNKFTPFVLFLLIPLFVVAQAFTGIEEIAPFSEGLAAIKKGEQWGFMNTKGDLVINFRSDLVFDRSADPSTFGIMGVKYPIFKQGRCLVKKVEEGIPYYGFIDTTGKLVIDYQFLNVAQYDSGYFTGIIFEKVFRGENEFKLKVYDYKFHEVLMDTSGKIIEYLAKPTNIQMTSKRYQTPWLRTKLLSETLIAVRNEDNSLEIRKITM